MSQVSQPSHDNGTHSTQEEVARLKAVLAAEQRTYRQPAVRMPYVIVAWCILIPGILWKVWDSVTEANWGETAAWTGLLCLTSQLHRIAQSHTQTRAARQLASMNHVAAVGILAEALEWPDTSTRESAIAALTRLLPQLNVDDAALLDEKQRACLYRMLQLQNAGRYSDLMQAILQALEQVGDEAALGYVERLAHSQPTTERQNQVKQAAVHCLPLLEEHIVATRSSRTLLRASAPERAGAAVLLRPASMGDTVVPEELLRAADGQNDPEH
jgi:hypothetical protein